MSEEKENEEQKWEPGLWLVDSDGHSRHHIGKAEDVNNVVEYAKMAKDDYELGTYIRAKFQKCISDTIKVEPNGSIKYSFPSAVEMAQDILKFLAMDPDERRKSINVAVKNTTRIDDKGNVLDANGTVIYDAFSKEAVAHKIEEMKNQIEDYVRLLGERCIADL